MPSTKSNIITLDTSQPIWEHFFTVAPLVVIGTKEGKNYDLAPKHMATPLGLDNFFGFVCTPRHSTYHNVKKEGYFTVSFPKPNQVVMASFAASPRCGEEGNEKTTLQNLPTFPAPHMDALFVQKGYLYLECEHFKTVDGFGEHSLICGKITGAYIDEQYLRLSEKDEQEMVYHSPLVAYLPHGRFAEIKETWAFPFPKDFKN
ncbi:MAG: flavin reductase [Saprospiraceae bacterium]